MRKSKIALPLLLLLVGCATTPIGQARQTVYLAEQSIEGTYRSIWVAVYNDQLPQSAGEEADRLYREVYYPTKVQVARYFRQWEETGQKPQNLDALVHTLRRIRMQLQRLRQQALTTRRAK